MKINKGESIIMRCHICNTQLNPSEIQWNKDHKDWEPCTTCLDEIDKVFSDDTEKEIESQLELENNEKFNDVLVAEEARSGNEDEDT